MSAQPCPVRMAELVMILSTLSTARAHTALRASSVSSMRMTAQTQHATMVVLALTKSGALNANAHLDSWVLAVKGTSMNACPTRAMRLALGIVFSWLTTTGVTAWMDGQGGIVEKGRTSVQTTLVRTMDSARMEKLDPFVLVNL